MYVPHPSRELQDLFAHKPYQGADPRQAEFVFVGLDANYAKEIEATPVFSKILEYHADGVAFWRKYDLHHPFLLPEYSGDGRRYHQTFARVGFTPAQASMVSFVELLHLPTVGRNILSPEDFAPDHLKWLDAIINEGSARYIFIPDRVARLMRASRYFPWLPRNPDRTLGALGIWFGSSGKTVYAHLHFSVYGKFERRKASEIVAIRNLIADTAGDPN